MTVGYIHWEETLNRKRKEGHRKGHQDVALKSWRKAFHTWASMSMVISHNFLSFSSSKAHSANPYSAASHPSGAGFTVTEAFSKYKPPLPSKSLERAAYTPVAQNWSMFMKALLSRCDSSTLTIDGWRGTPISRSSLYRLPGCTLSP